jgi:hypothetical protein
MIQLTLTYLFTKKIENIYISINIILYYNYHTMDEIEYLNFFPNITNTISNIPESVFKNIPEHVLKDFIKSNYTVKDTSPFKNICLTVIISFGFLHFLDTYEKVMSRFK